MADLTGYTSSSTEFSINSPTASVLGLRWDSAVDELFFHISLRSSASTPTKRRVLSEVAQLFGILAPVVITGKMFIQRLWSAGLNWDAPFPQDICDDWLIYRSTLATLNQVRVPRWLHVKSQGLTILHGFCDASAHACAAVMYTRTTDEEGCVYVYLVTARTKVAPLKGGTIPRLELCAAHLLAVTLQNVRVALGLTDVPYYLWSDSAIVLCWLRKQPTVLKPYISHRVREIQEMTSPDRWHHVRSAQNLADCASRGISPHDWLHHPPKWILKETLVMEKQIELSQKDSDIVQSENKVLSCTAVLPIQRSLMTRRLDGLVIPLVDSYSKIEKLFLTVAIVLRWTPSRKHLRQLVISAGELEDALDVLITMEQSNMFYVEIKQLKTGTRLPPASRLLPLNPNLDDKGLLRVGGRLKRAALSHGHRFPIISNFQSCPSPAPWSIF